LNVLCLVKYDIYLLLWKTTQTSRRRLPAVPFLGTQGANGLRYIEINERKLLTTEAPNLTVTDLPYP